MSTPSGASATTSSSDGLRLAHQLVGVLPERGGGASQRLRQGPAHGALQRRQALQPDRVAQEPGVEVRRVAPGTKAQGAAEGLHLLGVTSMSGFT